MHRVDAFFDALEVQVEVSGRIRPAQLSLGTPCDGWSIRKVMGHSIGVTLKFADFASGATDRPISPHGDLVGPDHYAALRSCADTARTAWASADMTRTCDLTFGSFSADLAAGINLFDVLAHTWDMAIGAGVELECADVLWNVGLDAARTVIGTNRDPVHYAEEMPVRPNAGAQERFLPSSAERDSRVPKDSRVRRRLTAPNRLIDGATCAGSSSRHRRHAAALFALRVCCWAESR